MAKLFRKAAIGVSPNGPDHPGQMPQNLDMDQGSVQISVHQLADTVMRSDQSFVPVAEAIREMAAPCHVNHRVEIWIQIAVQPAGVMLQLRSRIFGSSRSIAVADNHAELKSAFGAIRQQGWNPYNG